MFENKVCGGQQTVSRIASKVVLNSECVNIQKIMRGRGRVGRVGRGRGEREEGKREGKSRGVGMDTGTPTLLQGLG